MYKEGPSASDRKKVAREAVRIIVVIIMIIVIVIITANNNTNNNDSKNSSSNDNDNHKKKKNDSEKVSREAVQTGGRAGEAGGILRPVLP